MQKHLRIFHLLSVMERKYNLFGLDAKSREILHIVAEKQIAGLPTTTDDIAKETVTSRASVYRKISNLTNDGNLDQIYKDYQIHYHVSDNIIKYINDLRINIKKNI